MAVRYPGRRTDEGATPSPERGPGTPRASAYAESAYAESAYAESTFAESTFADSAGADGAPAGEAMRELARPRRLARHTPPRGTAPLALDENGRLRADDAITCTAPLAAAALVREALAMALPGVPVTVVAEGTAANDDMPDAASLAPAWAALRRTQQRVAASDVAMRLQHALANPLTALLFEAQLLEMEPLPPALAEAVGRIVTQCRRTIEVARRLDAAGAAPAGPGLGVAPAGENG